MSQIDEGFKKMLDGLKQTDEGRDQVMRGLEESWAGRRDLDAQIAALDETVTELQRLILEQGAELRALRVRLENGGTPS